MMRVVYYDLGTSNTRVYLIEENEVVYNDAHRSGSKDVSISGDKSVLIDSMGILYEKLLIENGIGDGDIDSIYASGMVTSPYGLIEIPHESTPIVLKELSKHIYPYYEKEFFKRDINLIPGVKTVEEDFSPDSYNVESINNMRGEEIEILGILSKLPEDFTENSILVLPGSHTHIAYISNGEMKDILSTFSGELYHALSEKTILSDFLKDKGSCIDEEMIEWGYECLLNFGMSRALYMSHTMAIFKVNSGLKRKSFIEGIVAGSVVQSLEINLKKKWLDIANIAVVGDTHISRVYELLLSKMEGSYNLATINNDLNCSFAARGMMELLKGVNEN